MKVGRPLLPVNLPYMQQTRSVINPYNSKSIEILNSAGPTINRSNESEVPTVFVQCAKLEIWFVINAITPIDRLDAMSVFMTIVEAEASRKRRGV